MLKAGGCKFVESDKRSNRRVASMMVKEAGTIAWIDTFKKDDVFVDIGANIGLYTMYAAKRVKEVHAFEPHVGNFHTLLRNVEANKFKNVIPYCIAVHDRKGFNRFNYKSMEIGSADHQFQSKIDGSGRPIDFVAFEMKYGTGLDHLWHPIGVQPNKVKLDVDGNEQLVLQGMEHLLATTIQEILCEYNPNLGSGIEAWMDRCGFDLKEHQMTQRGKKRLKAGDKLDDIPHNLLFVKK